MAVIVAAKLAESCTVYCDLIGTQLLYTIGVGIIMNNIPLGSLYYYTIIPPPPTKRLS